MSNTAAVALLAVFFLCIIVVALYVRSERLRVAFAVVLAIAAYVVGAISGGGA